jgi:hypothetical protein
VAGSLILVTVEITVDAVEDIKPKKGLFSLNFLHSSDDGLSKHGSFDLII